MIKYLDMKKYILILLSLLLANIAWGAVGDTFVEGDLKYTVISEDPCEVSVETAYNYYYISGEVVIPSKIFGNNKEYTVTEIGYQAFYLCSGITGELTIPDSVTKIGDRAFGECSGLSSVTIGRGLKSVGFDIFRGCNNLKAVSYNAEDCRNEYHRELFPSSVETVILGNNVRKLPEYMFKGCKNITSISIPNSVETIGLYAFSDCSGLQRLVLPNSVKSIEMYTFYNCSGLTSLVIPNSVILIGHEAFSGCSSLTSLVIPDSVIRIDSGAFNNCSGLQSVAIGKSVEVMNGRCFEGCNNVKEIIYEAENCENLSERDPLFTSRGLETVVFGENVKTIPHYMFEGCSNLTSIVIPDSVTSIGDYAFNNCSGLKELTIGEGVEDMGSKAFCGCDNLKDVIYNASNCQYCTLSASLETLVFGEQVKSIPSYICQNCDKLTSITIPNSVTSIGDYAFYGCSGLESLVIPDSVTSIGSSAFYGCSGLRSVEIGRGVKAIDYMVFVGCNNIKHVLFKAEECENSSSSDFPLFPSTVETVVLGEYVKSIPSYIFKNCDKLTSINLPNSVASIGSHAFYGCSGLLSVKIGRGFKSGGFYGCSNIKEVVFEAEDCEGCYLSSSLETVVFGENVKRIPGNMFYGCENLTTVTIPNSVTTIGNQAFRYCYGLQTVVIGNSVNSIENGAFRDCKKLISILIPESVNNIQEYAFDGCDNLKEVVFEAEDCKYTAKYDHSLFPSSVETVIFGEKVKTIPDYMFKSCENITSLTIPTSVETIGKSAFYGWSGIETVEIPNSVKTIGDYAFGGCTGLKTVLIGNSVRSIGQDAFASCSNLIKSAYPKTVTNPPFSRGLIVAYSPEEAIIEDGWIYGKDKTEILFVPYSFSGEYVVADKVTSIGESAFAYCSGLTSIVLSDSVTSIGESAFSYCTGLTSIKIPDLVTEMGSQAFLGCKELLSVEIGIGVKSLDYNVFGGCNKIKDILFKAEYCENNSEYTDRYYALFPSSVENVILGEEVKTIPSYIFKDCNNLKSINLPSSVISIGNEAFYRCTGIEVVELPYITKIGNSAFFGCHNLKSVLLGPSANSIGSYAFEDCYSLVKSAYPNTLSDPFSSGVRVAYNPDGAIIEDCLIFGNNKREILFAPYTFSGEYTLPDNVSSIGEYSFAFCTGLTAIVIPDSVTEIGSSAFRYCEGLLSVTVGRGVQSMDGSEFSECNNLRDVIFEAVDCKNSSDHEYSRLFPSSLETITFGENVKSIPSYMCGWCNKLTSLIIPGSVLSIGDGAFYNCSSLKSLEMGNSVTSLGENAFELCTELTSVRLSNSLSRIGSSAFEDCTKLKEIIIPPSVTKIGDNAFNSCISLEKIAMGNVKTISYGVFANVKPANIYVTAPEPPKLGRDVWYDEYYDDVYENAMLYVQDEAYKEAYMTSMYDWSQFTNISIMTVPTALTVDHTSIKGVPGDTFQLTAKLEPEDVTLPYIFWRSTNPEVAIVDHNGLVTLRQAEGISNPSEDGNQECKIIAETLYVNGPVIEVSVETDVMSEIEDIISEDIMSEDFYNDREDILQVYDLNGVKVGTKTDNLTPGIYIIRKGTEVKKIIVK